MSSENSVSESLSDTDRDLLRRSMREFLAPRWPAKGAVERSGDANRRHRVARARRSGTCRARRRHGRSGLARNRAGLRGARPRIVPGAAAWRGRRSTSRLAAQPSNAVRALLEDMHQGKASIALALGASMATLSAGRAEMRDDTLSGKLAFVEGAQARRISPSSSTKASRSPQAARRGVTIKATPGLAVPAFSEVAFDNTPAIRVPVPPETLADVALMVRLACAGRALGAAQRVVRNGRRARQDQKAVRPVHRPVPGDPAQARQLPDQPRRRADGDRDRGRRARRRQSGLADLRVVGASRSPDRRCAPYRSSRTGRSAPSAMPRSTRRRATSAACMPTSPASAACSAHAPSLPTSCSVPPE